MVELMTQTTNNLSDVLNGVPKTKLERFKKYIEQRMDNSLRSLKNEDKTENIYRAQGSVQELDKMLTDLNFLLNS